MTLGAKLIQHTVLSYLAAKTNTQLRREMEDDTKEIIIGIANE